MLMPGEPPRAAVNGNKPKPSPMQGQIAASLAANPDASTGAYLGPAMGDYSTVAGRVASGAPDPFSYAGDPILQKIEANNQQARIDAQTQATALRQQLAIQLGDASGLSDDAATAAAAANNPSSTLASLKKAFDQTSLNDDETLNKANLFYSGDRVKTIQGADTDYLGQVQAARDAALAQSGTIGSNLASALTTADNSDSAGEGDAYTRAVNLATTYGYDPAQNAANVNPPVENQNPGPYTPTKAPAITAAKPPVISHATVKPGPLATAISRPNAYLTSPTKRG